MDSCYNSRYIKETFSQDTFLQLMVYQIIFYLSEPRKIKKYTSYLSPNKSNKVFYGMVHFCNEFILKNFQEFLARDFEKDIAVDINTLVSNKEIRDKIINQLKRIYDLGYLPIEINAAEEGSLTLAHIPFVEIRLLNPNFPWVIDVVKELFYKIVPKCCAAATSYNNDAKILYYYYEWTSVEDWRDNSYMIDFNNNIDIVDSIVASSQLINFNNSFINSSNKLVNKNYLLYNKEKQKDFKLYNKCYYIGYDWYVCEDIDKNNFQEFILLNNFLKKI